MSQNETTEGSGQRVPDGLSSDLRAQSSRSGGFRSKVPELAVEALSVMFAVLLAFAVDQWRVDKNNAELAARARESILAEIEANRSELLDSRPQHDALLHQMEQNLEAIEADLSTQVSVDFAYSLLSSAAWQTAQVTQAAHYLDYDWIIRVSRMYDLQEQFRESQSGILDQISSFGATAAAAGDLGPVLRALRGRIGILVGLQDGLIGAYETVLEDAEAEAAGDPGGKLSGEPGGQ